MRNGSSKELENEEEPVRHVEGMVFLNLDSIVKEVVGDRGKASKAHSSEPPVAILRRQKGLEGRCDGDSSCQVINEGISRGV